MSAKCTSVSRRLAAIVAAGIMLTTSVAVAVEGSETPAVPGELVVTRPSDPVVPRPSTVIDRWRGMVLDGLIPGTAICGAGFAVEGHLGLCTHGPDTAPEGIDVTEPVETAELLVPFHDGTTAASSGSASIPCYGDGSSGKRIQVVYARPAGVPDRFGEIASALVSWVARVDRIVNDSAAKTGGIRHVRWVTTRDCKLVIQRVQLSENGADSYSNTVTELRRVGLGRSDRKYLVWVDANVYCGIASFTRDDSPGADNRNNSGPGYGRIDSRCWGRNNATEAHELMHLLGGVQDSAPNSTGGGHCTDEYDRMCYRDAPGVTMTYPCSSARNERLFDCNNDDYFSTAPKPGSYLTTHWNTANSLFLEPVPPDAWSPT